ncbi:MAG: carbohydrate ABC transporter permease [Synechococcus sp. BS307-5m-G36]|nr:carbohydrate ABC transporter permease [Synechococcus sp. BS307-5m-G36]MBL6880263.1 carbohydrate ABC transporter permease [Synechococcus sp. BS30m-G31]
MSMSRSWLASRHAVLVTLLLIWSLAPMAWQLISSFTSSEALVNGAIPFEQRWTLIHYRELLSSDPPFWRYLLNSTVVAGVSTVLTLVLAVPAAYVLAQLPLRWRRGIRRAVMAAALFPYVLLFLALLELARNFQLGNRLFALALPYSALAMPLALLLLTAAFEGLPKDLDDAARLEGLTLRQRLRWVMLPLIAPASASTAILVFLFAWNEYPIALTWLSRSDLLTLPVAMARIAGSSIYSIPYGAYAAATVLGAIPLLLLVLLFQRQIVSGLTNGAIKG